MKKCICLSLVAISILFCSVNHESLAQVVPYRVEGTGSINPSTGAFGGPSIGLHLGKFTFAGQLLSQTGGPLVYEWTATDTQTAANGDQIFLTGEGTVTLIPIVPPIFGAEWEGSWTVTGGTGRFANVQPAGDPIQMVASNDPFDATDLVTPRSFRYRKIGQIDLGKK